MINLDVGRRIKKMKYQIGDQAVHWMYGLGKITGLVEKSLAGKPCLYYVMAIGLLTTVYVPVEEAGESCLRPPTPSSEFTSLFRVLSNPGEQLLERHNERRVELAQRLKRRTMRDTCQIISDLNTRSQLHKLNLNDKDVLKRAKDLLLTEWGFSLGTLRVNAEQELELLLGKNQAVPEISL
jgi:RNA polymerase-interacting CarD/CdnL/TRCF family regulator